MAEEIDSFTVPLTVTRVPKCSFSQRDQAVFCVMLIDAADAWKLLLLERETPSKLCGSDLGPGAAHRGQAAHQGHCFIDPQFGPDPLQGLNADPLPAFHN